MKVFLVNCLQCGAWVSIPGVGKRSLGEGKATLKNSMDCIVHRVPYEWF